MKSVKKILSSLMVVSLLLAMVMVPVSADVSSQADTVRVLGVLKGDSAEGVTEVYLAKSTNRSQGARILLRLMGLETEADAFSGSATFSDASDASSYWQHMLAYLKANPEVGFRGYPDGTFKPNKVMTAQEIYKVLLTSLGYEENVDFTWSEVFTFAAEKGLTALYGTQNITNDDLATALVEALNATKKDGVRLINFLVQEGVVTSTKATEAGFTIITALDNEATYNCLFGGTPEWPATLNATYSDGSTGTVAVTWSAINSNLIGTQSATGTVAGYGVINVSVEVLPETLTVMDAFPSNGNEITVLLNKPAPAGVIVRLKRGLVGITTNVEWAENRKSFKFTQSWNFSMGEYTVFVENSEKTFNIELERVDAVYINADNIYPLADQDLQVNFVNQYGQMMNITNATISITNVTKGLQVPYTLVGTTVKVNGADVSKISPGDTLMVFVMHNTSTLSATKQINVLETPVIKNLQFGAVTIFNNQPTIVEHTNGHKIQLFATDQYGNQITLTNADIQPGGAIVPVSQNDAIIDHTTLFIDSEGNLVFNANDPGQCAITLLVPTEGITPSQTFTVYALSTIDNLSIAGAAGAVKAGDTVDLIASATDQYNNPVALLGNYDHSKAAYTIAGITAAVTYDSTRGVIQLIAGSVGTGTISYTYDGQYMGMFQVTIVEEAKPAQITGFDIPEAFQVGATKVVTLDNIEVKDQYGDPFDITGTTYKIQMELVGSSSTYLGISAPSYLGTGSAALTFTATSTQGTATVKLTVLDNTSTVLSTYQTTIEVVGSEDITTYTFDSVPTMYAGGVGATEYYKTLVMNGKTSSGKVVQLAGAGGKPAGIDAITNSNETAFTIDTNTLVIYATAAGNTQIKAWKSGIVVATVTITASATAPTPTTMHFTEDAITVANGFAMNAKALLVVKDQYGVNITGTATLIFTTSNSAIATIDQGTGAIATSASNDGSTIISAIASSGVLSDTFTLNVE